MKDANPLKHTFLQGICNICKKKYIFVPHYFLFLLEGSKKKIGMAN